MVGILLRMQAVRFAATVLWLFWPIGCEPLVVQHGVQLQSRDGGTPGLAGGSGHLEPTADGARVERAACTGADDDTECDDLDICTRSSRCRAGVCQGGNSFDSCVVADALAEFHEQQGVDGWFYGFWNASADADGSYDAETDFTPMEYCGDSLWSPPGRCDEIRGEPGYRWTRVMDWALLHPETEPDLELPIRRWVSDVSGPARISVEHSVSGMSGDGTRALLLVDGAELWRNDTRENVSTHAAIDTDLRVGTVVDQLVHPIGSSADDMTTFSMKIEGR